VRGRDSNGIPSKTVGPRVKKDPLLRGYGLRRPLCCGILAPPWQNPVDSGNWSVTDAF